MTTLLFKNGILIRGSGPVREDLRVQDGKIVEIGNGLSDEGADEVVDCTGRYIMPGLIDGHVHLRTPGEEYKEDWTTGTRAAAAGGVTTVLDMPNNVPPVTSRAALEHKAKLIHGKSVVNYALYMGATVNNIEEFLASEAVALKVYMGSSTGDLLVDDPVALETIFKKAASVDRLVCVHAEDESLIKFHTEQYAGDENPMVHGRIRDDEVAYRAVKHALHLAKKHGTRLHVCHLSSERELEEFHEFKHENISCEVTPHHLFLDELELGRRKNFAKVNPPLRTDHDRETLMEGVSSGLVTCVATDHAPHTREEKEQPYSRAPSGVPGLETILPLLLDAVNRGQLSLEDVVRVTAYGPAKVFRLKNKGALEMNHDADLVVVDMNLKQAVENGGPGARYTKCGWSPFAGEILHGWPVMTVVNGEIVLREGKVLDRPVGRHLAV